MKKILIITYHFPPDASVGSVRPAKFCKYLPAFGWIPIVLTVNARYHKTTDASRMADVLSCHVHATGMLPNVSALYLRLKRYFTVDRGHRANPSLCRDQNRQGPLSAFRRLLASVECVPDDKQPWIPLAAVHALRLLMTERVDAVMTSGPPMSCHVVGLVLKRLTGVRWIADFRDPWMLHREASLISSTGPSRAAEAWLEKHTLRRADRILVTTERMQVELQQRHPSVAEKTTVILNGYDPPDFEAAAAAPRSDRRFTLTHAGTMYYHRTAGAFLASLERLLFRGDIPRWNIVVNFLGHSPGVHERARELGLDDVVAVHRPVDYHTCIESLVASDVLLLFAQGQPLQIPAKFYDYVAVKKPFIVIAEDGATADLARKFDRAVVVHPDDQTGLRSHLLALYEDFARGCLDTPELPQEVADNIITRFELTRALVRVID